MSQVFERKSLILAFLRVRRKRKSVILPFARVLFNSIIVVRYYKVRAIIEQFKGSPQVRDIIKFTNFT